MIDTIFSVSISIILILVIRKIFARQISSKLIYALWLIPAMQLLLFGHSLHLETEFYLEIFDTFEKTPLQKIVPDMYEKLEYNLNQVLISGESYSPELINDLEIVNLKTGITVWETLYIIW